MRFDDTYSARDYRRECTRDDSWRQRQDAAQRDQALAMVEHLAEMDRLKRRLARRVAVASKRAGY